MIHLGLYEISEIIVGIIFWWVGIYFLSRNPYIMLSWVAFGLLAGFGFSMLADPILTNTRSLAENAFWEKIAEWPLFFAPIFYLHASLLTTPRRKKFHNYLLAFSYFGAAVFYILAIQGGWILQESIVRNPNYKFNYEYYAFAPGVLLLPVVIYESTCVGLAIKNFITEIKNGFWKYFLPALGGFFYIISGAALATGYYLPIPFTPIYSSIGITIATLLIIYPILRYHLFTPSEKIIFGKDFFYLSLAMFLLSSVYLGIFFISGLTFEFPALVFLILLLILILTTHSFYDWLTTFVRDIVYNISSGLSVVNDEEVHQALRNYNRPERLEDNQLLRLNLISQKVKKGEAKTPVDALRLIIKDAIEYFSPDEENSRRNKQNLKYHLLKMIAFDQAEEGQILWELGFEEYPVRIMGKESEARPPLFKSLSPSDYTYTSRNAFIALKKEAIHDVAWRISYLEKLAKKKII